MTGVSTLQDGSNRIAGHSSATPLEDVGDGKHRDVRVFPRGSLAVTLVDPAGDTVSGGGSGGGDGTIKATVLDLTNANPLAVAVTDANGDQLTSFGGGTEYTEDAAAAADPVGGMLIARRRDTLSATEVSADGDTIALNATSKGELNVFDKSASGTLDQIKIAVEDLSSGNNEPIEEGAVINPLFAPINAARARTTPAAEAGVADGDAVILNATPKGELYVKHADPIPAGTNNIGDVDVASLPATPAGTNLIGAVSAKIATDAIMDGTTALTPKFAPIDAASSGDNTLVAAVNPKKIRVLALFLVSAGTVTARFESGAGGAALTGQMNLVANSGFTLPFNPAGWFETASNTLLNLELSGAVSVDGCLTYIEI
ncbi:MAG: hypothetical protein AB7G35_10205 [Hyphomicrobiaceae bacterium]